MEKEVYYVLGVMSGTSLDGIDIAHIVFEKQDSWKYEIRTAETIPYTEDWKRRLTTAIHFDENQLIEIDKEYTAFLADVIRKFTTKHDIHELDAVCSHGHTIKHEPENGFTLQIGNLPELASLLKKRVVCNFRVQDVKLGGQGAPLVPIGDALLFGNYEFCLNLGGFANVSTSLRGERIAYDICPVNTVMNYLAEQLGQPFDEGGKIAAGGRLDQRLLNDLNELDFYRQKPPKSLGMEWVYRFIIPRLDKGMNIPDLMHTYAVHVAEQLAENLKSSIEASVLITGGGAFNSFLLEELSKRTSTSLVVPSEKLVNYKEALVFGLLGVLRMRGEINTLSSVTGSYRDHSAGEIFEG